MWRVECGDCLELMKGLEACSVDCVITDPPYKKEFNHLYGRVAEEAKRVLKDGGLFFTLCGHHSFSQILADMTAHLDFYWIGGMPNSSGSVARYHPRQMMMGWKPCVWLSKGKPAKHPYVFDFFKTTRIERENHEWEQPVSWFNYYVEKITPDGCTVLDPFCGSGTTGVACMQTGRNFIGFEIDPGYCEIARRRIGEAESNLYAKAS